MKLLWFSHFIPYPPRGGGHQRSFNLLRHASRSYEISLIAFNLHGHSRRQLDEWRRELKKYCAEVEFWEMPIRWRSAAWWVRLGTSAFDRVPYGCRSFWSRDLEAQWRAALRRHQGALIHFDSIDLALFVDAAAGFRKVLNHHNCESAMSQRRAQNERNPVGKIYLRSQSHKLARIERAVCQLFDVNTAVSRVDMHLLQEKTPRAHFHVVANGTDASYFKPTSAQEEANTLIFAGSLNRYANISALRFFVGRVWPLVKQQFPSLRFYVAGKRPSNSLVRWLKRDSNVVVVADPEDIRPWIARAAVFVCPILDGGGTKLKILDAVAMGKAVVTTSIGCEGLDLKHGEHVLISDSPHDFARMIFLALRNGARRKQLGECGRAFVERYHSWAIIGEHLADAYRCAVSSGACTASEPLHVN